MFKRGANVRFVGSAVTKPVCRALPGRVKIGTGVATTGELYTRLSQAKAASSADE
jgi:hypothetical protein